MEDASGGEAYYYGNQGEVVKTVRSVMVSTADVRTYVYGATYDSRNRVRTMTYPDGEVVTYGYNAAGQVESIRSERQGKEETIVEEVAMTRKDIPSIPAWATERRPPIPMTDSVNACRR